MNNTFDFGTALKAIRASKDVQRASWNSKLVYLFLVKGNILTAAISGKNGIYRGLQHKQTCLQMTGKNANIKAADNTAALF